MSSSQCSERLAYEPLCEHHASVLIQALTDPRAYTYIAGPHPTNSEDLAQAFARMASGPTRNRPNETWWNYAVRLQNGEYIRRIEATLHSGLAEVAYVFGSAYWHCGYATESLTWLHAQLQSHNIKSTWASVLPTNTRSIQLLERLCYTQVLQEHPKLLSYDPGDSVYCRVFLG